MNGETIAQIIIYALKLGEMVGSAVIKEREAQAKILQLQMEQRGPSPDEWKRVDAEVDRLHKEIQNA